MSTTMRLTERERTAAPPARSPMWSTGRTGSRRHGDSRGGDTLRVASLQPMMAGARHHHGEMTQPGGCRHGGSRLVESVSHRIIVDRLVGCCDELPTASMTFRPPGLPRSSHVRVASVTANHAASRRPGALQLDRRAGAGRRRSKRVCLSVTAAARRHRMVRTRATLIVRGWVVRARRRTNVRPGWPRSSHEVSRVQNRNVTMSEPQVELSRSEAMKRNVIKRKLELHKNTVLHLDSHLKAVHGGFSQSCPTLGEFSCQIFCPSVLNCSDGGA